MLLPVCEMGGFVSISWMRASSPPKKSSCTRMTPWMRTLEVSPGRTSMRPEPVSTFRSTAPLTVRVRSKEPSRWAAADCRTNPAKARAAVAWLNLIEPPVREDRRRGWPNVSFCDRVSFMRYLLPLSIICSIVVCLHASPADNPEGEGLRRPPALRFASPADKPEGWGPVQSLVGDWTGEGGGGPGQGSGTFSFKPDLQGKILVRRNRAEYPATKERAAF